MHITARLALFFIACNSTACAQNKLSLTQSESGLKVIVINKKFPLLKILLPGQPETERGIEVEFPEHVTGLNTQTGNIEHIYLVTRGNQNKRTPAQWKKEDNTLIYETDLNNAIKLVAKVQLEKDGISYSYRLTNHSSVAYQSLQAVTCVKLYSAFSDTLLQRTYVHHADGFDLLASETPERLTMPLNKWLPCRYLVSYTWPVPDSKVEKDADNITRYNKSRKVDMPFIATLSHDNQWIAATYTRETGNLWNNPERSCQHADPAIDLKPGETKSLQLKTFIRKGTLDDLLRTIITYKKIRALSKNTDGYLN